ncbi:MAG: biotin/lipoyl-binding protein [Dehalococcoidia bacterium]|nr:biotin/lipoyl-binding protein [Dehalococcoidia bacterium]
MDDGAGPRAVSVGANEARVDGVPVAAEDVASVAATAELDGSVTVRVATGEYRLRTVRPPATAAGGRAGEGPAGEVRAPLSGRVAAVNVQAGDSVEDGDIVAVLDAMKMEHAIPAPGAGAVKAVHVAPDEVVEAGALLVELE